MSRWIAGRCQEVDCPTPRRQLNLPLGPFAQIGKLRPLRRPSTTSGLLSIFPGHLQVPFSPDGLPVGPFLCTKYDPLPTCLPPPLLPGQVIEGAGRCPRPARSTILDGVPTASDNLSKLRILSSEIRRGCPARKQFANGARPPAPRRSRQMPRRIENGRLPCPRFRRRRVDVELSVACGPRIDGASRWMLQRTEPRGVFQHDEKVRSRRA